MGEDTGRRPLGTREQKQRQTRLRIAEEGLRLFQTTGYDATTLEAVAAAAGVSARTLYHYFRTKHDILLFFHDHNFVADIGPAIAAFPSSWGPYRVTRACFLELVPKYEVATMATTYRIWNSTETLRAQKQLMFLQIEAAIFRALTDIWPTAAEAMRLRLISMVSTAALRLAMDAWQHETASPPLRARLEASFDLLATLAAPSDASS